MYVLPLFQPLSFIGLTAIITCIVNSKLRQRAFLGTKNNPLTDRSSRGYPVGADTVDVLPLFCLNQVICINFFIFFTNNLLFT